MKDLNGNDLEVGDPVSWRASHTRGFRRGTVRKVTDAWALIDDGDPCNPDRMTNGMHVSELVDTPKRIRRKMKGWTDVEARAWLLHNGFVEKLAGFALPSSVWGFPVLVTPVGASWAVSAGTVHHDTVTTDDMITFFRERERT